MSKDYLPNPVTVASFAERLSRQGGRIGLVFAVVTAVSLGIVTLRSLQDMAERDRERDSHRGR
jgi:hypothetical protein